ncbi:hypothetical protein VZH09_01820 [Synechococcus elongatus IITB7]|uniref:type IV pilus modification PilV family protein n=1 Tax=Synechococcus elongatus TaxID=32046 RepID=UPI0030CAF76D
MKFFSHRFYRHPQSYYQRRRSHQGSSIVEVLVSAILLTIVATGTVGAIQITAQTSSFSRVNQFTSSRIVSDVEQARAIANQLCRASDNNYGLENSCAGSVTLQTLCNPSSTPSFAEAIAAQLPAFNENGWPNNRGILQGSRIDQDLDTSQQTVLVLNYRDRDNNNRLVKQAEVIPPALAYCPCSVDNPISNSGGGVAICRS